MIEQFTIPSYGGIGRYFKRVTISLMISAATVFMITKKINGPTIILTFVLAFILYTLISSATGNNLAGSINSTVYPNPPHLGLDGVDLQNQYKYPQ
jgi:hypothetical protein